MHEFHPRRVQVRSGNGMELPVLHGSSELPAPTAQSRLCSIAQWDFVFDDKLGSVAA